MDCCLQKNSKINLPYFCALACPERLAEIYKKIKNHKSPHGVGIKTVFESHGSRERDSIDFELCLFRS